ncbi:UNVERIFIED_CONTAM: hypothetical protein Sangu_1008900 [Sesamum angustifolium]|uniref:DUF4283 domain-containing protein n=1 Tax=Sesamum angustifolium TaxID=2727405 RepID=A0AAW2PI20_9LAMI
MKGSLTFVAYVDYWEILIGIVCAITKRGLWNLEANYNMASGSELLCTRAYSVQEAGHQAHGQVQQGHTDSSAVEGEHSHRRGCSIFDPFTVIPARERQMGEVDNVILSKKLNLKRSRDYEDRVQGGGVHKDSPYGQNNNAQSVQRDGLWAIVFTTLTEGSTKIFPQKPITATRKRKLPASLSSHQSKRQNIPEISVEVAMRPAGSHDCISLELPRGRGPLDSSKTRRVSPMYIPLFVFLSDTKSRKNIVDFIRNKFDLYGVEVPAQGRWGGLMILWTKEMMVQLRSFSKEHIDVEIRGNSVMGMWRMTGFYGTLLVAHQQQSRKRLIQLAHQPDMPWLCVGDFNEILSKGEKLE